MVGLIQVSEKIPGADDVACSCSWNLPKGLLRGITSQAVGRRWPRFEVYRRQVDGEPKYIIVGEESEGRYHLVGIFFREEWFDHLMIEKAVAGVEIPWRPKASSVFNAGSTVLLVIVSVGFAALALSGGVLLLGELFILTVGGVLGGFGAFFFCDYQDHKKKLSRLRATLRNLDTLKLEAT